jgi:hypothetical protein
MIILNTPIPAKHAVKTLFDWFTQCLMTIVNKPSSGQKIHFVYFSYEPDFHYLTLSVKSLLRSIEPELIGSINIFVDQKAPFSELQTRAIEAIYNKIIFHKVEHFDWASIESTFAELKCFKKVSENAGAQDLIAKVDSDILFFESAKLKRLLFSNYACIGDGHSEQYKFMQGGFYLLRKSLLDKIIQDADLDLVSKVGAQLNTNAEDRIISKLASEKTNVLMTRLMLFPSEYQQLNYLSTFNRWDFTCGHFVKDKERMQRYFDDVFCSR